MNKVKPANILSSLSMSGYRSFGVKRQRFSVFSQINILIGQNNCGKSNVLRFIHDWLAYAGGRHGLPVRDEHEKHLLANAPLSYGFRVSCGQDGEVDRLLAESI